jgi:hypothetical protein
VTILKCRDTCFPLLGHITWQGGEDIGEDGEIGHKSGTLHPKTLNNSFILE